MMTNRYSPLWIVALVEELEKLRKNGNVNQREWIDGFIHALFVARVLSWAEFQRLDALVMNALENYWKAQDIQF